MTRILTRGDPESVLEPAACVAALDEGFRSTDPWSGAGERVRTDLPFPGTATALIPGVPPGIDAYTVKVNAKFPGARPALRGVICLHSGHDGELLALLDSATITAWRTGLAAALGTHVLTNPGPGAGTALGVIGAGAQAELMVRGLRELRGIHEVVVHDTDPGRADAFAARHGGRVLGSPAEVASASEVVLPATWSRTPLPHLADTRPGQHLTSRGAGEPGKQELSADLLASSAVVVDDRELAGSTGGLAAAARATLGEILRAGPPGRTDRAERTVYAPVGLPRQDLALAWLAYRQAGRRGIGTHTDLLS
ncbi:NAD(P)-binding domain-containing protein [Streptomyces sp. ITFR-16]|uniref:ornithine cyclodeaminase family protein n=1 Tax=Streptomyces sp. ITFR-16 TaxID=3075198 RepID=UPI00288A4138|nr:NAD(P)-binding domain-containing protein [Streptomyces sp. ITFR-16]WNI26634.1 NAD(P)-binding domain-containing protein [Streptomyces sp. ITFR-16]